MKNYREREPYPFTSLGHIIRPAKHTISLESEFAQSLKHAMCLLRALTLISKCWDLGYLLIVLLGVGKIHRANPCAMLISGALAAVGGDD